jgi:hypothetical protein
MSESIVFVLEDQFAELFEKHGDQYLEFDKIVNPKHPRPDICAFLILHDLTGDSASSANNMVSSTNDDAIYLSVELSDLSGKITEDDILALIRCGVWLDKENDCLAMFV